MDNKEIYKRISLIEKDECFSQFLYDAYAGLYGELDAIIQYSYEDLLIQNEDIKKRLKDISIDEMRHLNILGNMLIKLGRKPVYMNKDNELFSCDKVMYNFKSLKDVLVFNINLEKESIALYNNLLDYTNDLNVKFVINSIKKEEEKHLNIFKDILIAL